MVKAAQEQLADLGAATLRCYVEPDNTPSILLQKSMGFTEKEFQSFNDLINDGEIMFEIDIPNRLSVIPATKNEEYFVRIMFANNKEALHKENSILPEWEKLLEQNNPDEKHFLICKGAMPVAYMKINGVESVDTAWISMLFVSPKYQRQGIGSFAIQYAEKYVKDKGGSNVVIQTDKDNIPAQKCYSKCGYQLINRGDKYQYVKMIR